MCCSLLAQRAAHQRQQRVLCCASAPLISPLYQPGQPSRAAEGALLPVLPVLVLLVLPLLVVRTSWYRRTDTCNHHLCTSTSTVLVVLRGTGR
jgi:hypothetical protein